MTPPPRESLRRRLGRALRGVDAIQYGRPVATRLEDISPPPSPLTVVEPPQPNSARPLDKDRTAEF